MVDFDNNRPVTKQQVWVIWPVIDFTTVIKQDSNIVYEQFDQTSVLLMY